MPQPLKRCKDDYAKPTYSPLRTGFLKLTPGDLKCRIYCKGSVCKYCTIDGFPEAKQALTGLYSTWVTPNILAMARPLVEHFDKCGIVKQFRDHNIRSVVNLEEPGEHAFCGPGNLASGFTYDPERLMRENIYYYNFPLPDFEACHTATLLDIVKVLNFALDQGKVAIHCHAGHGRTGMLIAAILIYRDGMRPAEAVRRVRAMRPQSVQSREQVHTLNRMHASLEEAGGVLLGEGHAWKDMDAALAYQKPFITNAQSRLYCHVPKVVHVICQAMLNLHYKNASIAYGRTVNGECRNALRVETEGERIESPSPVSLLISLLDRRPLASFDDWMEQKREDMTLINVEQHVQNQPLSTLLYFLDAFFSCFQPPLANEVDVLKLLDQQHLSYDDDVTVTQQWHWSALLLARCLCLALPRFAPETALLLVIWLTRGERGDERVAERMLEYMRRFCV